MPPHQELGQGPAVEIVEEPTDGSDQRRAERFGCAHPVEYEVPSLGQLERFGQQLTVVVNENPLVTQRLGEAIVLDLGLRRPHDVIEEQRADVLGREP